MGVLREFEIDVLTRLGGRTLSAAQVTQLSEEAELKALDFSGVGYFLTLRHSKLPVERTVLSDPTVLGNSGDLLTGFIAFVENGELTLECFSYGGEDVPKYYRDFDVTVFEESA